MSYHVICRSNNREFTLQNEVIKGKYISILKDIKRRYKFSLFAYCIMDNHIHLLIKMQEDSLAMIMKAINQRFAQWINRTYKRTGHLFENRYHAILIETTHGIKCVIKYIHRNPVMAGIFSGLNYKWSSHSTYIKRSNRAWFDCSEALDLFSEKRCDARASYYKFVAPPMNFENLYFSKNITEKDLEDYENCCIPGLESTFLIDRISIERKSIRKII